MLERNAPCDESLRGWEYALKMINQQYQFFVAARRRWPTISTRKRSTTNWPARTGSDSAKAGVGACVKVIVEEGTEQFLVNLLYVLRECFQEESTG